MENMETIINNLHYELLDKITDTVNRSYQQLKNDITVKYRGNNITTKDEVLKLMNTKVEKEELLCYLNQKSSLKDSYETRKGLDVLHQQIKHICVIMVEFLRQEVSKYTNSNDLSTLNHK